MPGDDQRNHLVDEERVAQGDRSLARRPCGCAPAAVAHLIAPLNRLSMALGRLFPRPGNLSACPPPPPPLGSFDCLQSSRELNRTHPSRRLVPPAPSPSR